LPKKKKAATRELPGVKQSSGTNQLFADETRKNDLKASLKMLGWLNDTLDVAATSAGKHVSRNAVLALLILHKNREAQRGRTFLQLYRAWRVAAKSTAVEESLRIALGQLILAGLVTVGKVGDIATSKFQERDLQRLIGTLLQSGLQPLRRVQLTDEAIERVDKIRETIDQRIEELRKDVTLHDRKIFDRMIKESLPYPPTKPPQPAKPLGV
jgi:hypothetical protein